jgi:hypothetical protein
LASSIPIWPCGVVVAVAYLLEDSTLARSCSSGKRSVDEVNPSLGRLVGSREENACIIPLQEVKGSAQDQYRHVGIAEVILGSAPSTLSLPVDRQTAPYCLLLRRSRHTAAGPVDLAIKTASNRVARLGCTRMAGFHRIGGTSGSITLHSVAAFHCNQHWR